MVQWAASGVQGYIHKGEIKTQSSELHCVIQWKHIRLHVKRDAAILQPAEWNCGCRRQRGRGGGGIKSGDCIKQPLEIPLLQREAEKQVQVCGATFVLCQQIHFSLQEKNTLGNHNIFHYTPALNYCIPERLPQSPSYWAEQNPALLCMAHPGREPLWDVESILIPSL